MRFKKEGVSPEYLRVFWSWNATGKWQAPQSPRITFLLKGSILYKLYIVHRLARLDAPLKEDPSQDFLKVLLPEFDKYLVLNP